MLKDDKLSYKIGINVNTSRGIEQMKKLIVIVSMLCIFLVGCSKEDTSSYDKYLEEGKTAVANEEYEEARNLFSLAKEESSNDGEGNALYNQTNNLIEAIDSKEKNHYDIAIRLCISIEKIDSKSDIIKSVAKDLKKECEDLKNNPSKQKKAATEKKEAKKETKEEKTVEDSSEIVSIKDDYNKRAKEAESLLVKRDGIFRYHGALINILRSYNIDDVKNAKEVYELSDDLLNSLYKSLKKDLDEDSFNRLKDEQIQWVKVKMEKEKNLDKYKILVYQTVGNMTIDRCEELNGRYYR